MLRLWALLLCAFLALPAQANFQSSLIASKRPKEGAAIVPWTLADWLAQKNKMRLQDQWLAMHSSQRWTELAFSGVGEQYTLKTQSPTAATTSTAQTAQDFQSDLFIGFFSINGEYQKTNDSKESYGGAAGLRLLGTAAQSTALIGRFGWRQLTDLTTRERWQNQYAEVLLQLYIVQHFGLAGSYRYYFPATSNQDDRLLGHKVTAGVFFEFSPFRIYADYFQEPLQITTTGVVSTQTSDGFQAGLKIFF